MEKGIKLFNIKNIKLFDNFLFDCDGVLWRGDIPINGVSDVINRLYNENKQIFFIVLIHLYRQIIVLKLERKMLKN